jgi:APA family basic amino acid/polyamine antiporter
MFWSVHSGIIAAIAVMMGRYTAYFVPLGENGVRVVAMTAVLVLSSINYLGIKQGSVVQLLLTVAKLAAVGLMVLCFFVFGGAAHRGLPAAVPSQPITFRAYALAVAAGLFAFGGWHMVTYSAGETRMPELNIPRALLFGVLVVTAIYIVLNAAYLYVLPLSRVAGSTHVAADAMEQVLGKGAAGAIAVLVILSALSALNGIILAGPRVYYAMAHDGLAFPWLAAVHPQRQTPYLAIAAQAIWSCVLIATNSYRALFSRVVYTEWVFFSLLAAGLFILRRRGGYRPYILSRGYAVITVAFIVASLGIVWNQLRADPRGSAVGLSLILLGLPVYFVWSQQLPKRAAADAHH